MVSFSHLFLLLAVGSQAYAQSCYYAANKLASNNYIPCGSLDNGPQSCCHLGDNCLADGNCFSLSTGMTYIAGCTDSSYKDGTCGAQQCQKNTQIQGIAMPCSDSPGTWQCCTGSGQQADNPSRTPQGSCPCDSSAGDVASGVTGFALTAVLPQSTGGQIALIAGNGATTAYINVPIASSSAAVTTSSSTVSSTSATATSSDQTTSSSPSTSIVQSTSSTSNSQPTGSSSSSNSQTAAATTSSGSTTSSTSSADSTSGQSGASGSNTNLKLILGISIPIIILFLGAVGYLGYRYYQKRHYSNRNSWGGAWDPFRHQPAGSGMRASRSSAVWDSSYNPVPSGAATGAAGDDVAEAVRKNAEQHRRQYSDSGGLRPMSELGGFVPWKGGQTTS